MAKSLTISNRMHKRNFLCSSDLRENEASIVMHPISVFSELRTYFQAVAITKVVRLLVDFCRLL